ncbi:MAG: twin-arginine translocation signal domain-containing protein [Acidobacteria bacterium]|nr:twin-arginine translocation signal domain-containing protein [Acidobacteriota bacterium]
MNRRHFLKNTAGALAGGAALTGHVSAQPPPQPADADALTTERSGADCMVDVLKQIGLEYICANPGSSFRGLHEAIVNYGGNSKPELITCLHEESSVAMAHGFAKIDGKPIGVMAHGTVGLQHAAMAVYNAYCDRVPVYIIVGNTLDATERRPGVEWAHSVQDASSLVRDFSKWDDTPVSLEHFAESAVRAYQLAMTPPMGPVLLVADSELQERPLGADFKLRIPRLALTAPPQGDTAAIVEVARMLVAAETPVIVADRAARTPAGLASLVQLAETLQAAVVDQGGRLNLPSRHPLNQSAQSRAVISSADVVLGLELTDFWGTVHTYRDQLHRSSQSLLKSGAKTIAISTRDLGVKANYQEFQRYPELDLMVSGDAEASLPSLVDAVKTLVTAGRRRVFDERGKKLAAASRAAYDRSRADAAYAWDASPVTTARLSVEVWNAIKGEDWSLVSSLNPISGWPMRLWDFDRQYQFIGGSGGSGIGYTAPASAGAALANRPHGRLTVTIQPDGDLMYAPGILWTAAHHHIPLLSVMHNNRAYHQELMHLQRMANRHNRGIDRAHIGTTIERPNIDYAKLAQSMGVYAEGPIENPADLAPALRRAIAVVKRGEPALVDVVTQPR